VAAGGGFGNHTEVKMSFSKVREEMQGGFGATHEWIAQAGAK